MADEETQIEPAAEEAPEPKAPTTTEGRRDATPDGRPPPAEATASAPETAREAVEAEPAAETAEPVNRGC